MQKTQRYIIRNVREIKPRVATQSSMQVCNPRPKFTLH